MIKTRKVAVVITARPSYSRVKTVLTALKKDKAIELQIIAAASCLLDRYGSTSNFIQKDGFKLTSKVYNVLEGDNLTSMAKTTGLGIMELSDVFLHLQPDVVVTIADRFETMSTAISASYMNIPLAHIQGGEISGNIDEKVRHSITKLADVHLVATNQAHQRVIKLGEDPGFVHNTGCPSIDIAHTVSESPALDFDPFVKYGGVGEEFAMDKGNYLVVMQHPVTTDYAAGLEQINTTLNVIKELGVPAFWFWPNVDAGSDRVSKGIRRFRELNRNLKIHFFKNMEPDDFLKLLINSTCLIGNSSVGIRECSFLGIPVVNIGDRQGGRERGKNVIDVDYDGRAIKKAISSQINHGSYEKDTLYGDGEAGARIAKILRDTNLRYSKKLMF